MVPETEEEIAEYDWENFLPSRHGNPVGSFSIVDEYAGIEGKLITRLAFIHGQVRGLVFAENVTIEKTGLVSGTIFCRNLTVLGTARGNIICDQVLVRTGGLLTSNLKYRCLNVEPGGLVGGQFEHRRWIDNKSIAPDPAAVSSVLAQGQKLR